MVENRVSNSQLEELLDYLALHPNLAKGVGLGVRSKETIDKEWGDLARKLNSHGSGASKSGLRWKRYWIDFKHKAKSRAAARRREASGTGGGPAVEAVLSETDKKILNIIGEGAVYGDTQHRIPVFPVHQTSSSKNPNFKEIGLDKNHLDVTENSIDQESMELLAMHSSGRNDNQDTVDKDTSELLPVHDNNLQEITNQDAGTRERKLQQKYQSPSAKKQKIEANWVVELERKRVEAENKISNAVMIMAEASRTQAEAALIQANAAKMQAEAAKLQAEVMKTQTECLLKVLEELKK